MEKSLGLSNRQLTILSWFFILPILLFFTTCILFFYNMSSTGLPSQTNNKLAQTTSPKNTVDGGTANTNFATSARRCNDIASVVENQGPSMKSQSGEDKRLLVWFGDLCNGTYVELGALDGVR